MTRIRPIFAAVLLLAAPAFAQTSQPDQAAEAYLSGARDLEHKDYAAAQTDFARAASLAPTRKDYAAAANLARNGRIADLLQQAARARLLNQPSRADLLLAEATRVDPANELVRQHTAARADLASPPRGTITPTATKYTIAPAIHIVPTPGPKDLNLRGDARQAITQAAQAFGIKTVYDESVTPTPVRIELTQLPYEQTIEILLRLSHLFAVPLDEKTIFIAKDTQENRQRLERQLEETIYVPGSTSEQLNELTAVVRNVFDVHQAVVSQTLGTLTIRAPEPTLAAVNITLNDLIAGNAEVVLDLKLMTIDKSRSLNTGLTPPTSATAFNVYSEAKTIVGANQSLIDQAIASGAYTPTGNVITDTIFEAAYLVLAGVAKNANFSNLVALLGSTSNPTALLTGIAVGSGATFNFGMNTSESRALDDITVRVEDRQTTTLRVGEKYPITTSTYSSGLSGAAASALGGATINGVKVSSLLSSLSTATVPIITFEDLGLTLKTTPTVLKSGLVAIHVDFKLEALTGASLDDIPILTSRNFVSDITIADGSTALMLSSLSRNEQSALNGIPGLSDLPGFRQSTADTLAETNSSELVLLVTPHVVRHRPAVLAGPRIPFATSVPQDN